ncbi:hypothetical protein ACET3Z_017365 [Daucus carota]
MVLVDADCTHDVSIITSRNWKTGAGQSLCVADAVKMNNINFLQLLPRTNGFKLLKIGGLLFAELAAFTIPWTETFKFGTRPRNHLCLFSDVV